MSLLWYTRGIAQCGPRGNTLLQEMPSSNNENQSNMLRRSQFPVVKSRDRLKTKVTFSSWRQEVDIRNILSGCGRVMRGAAEQKNVLTLPGFGPSPKPNNYTDYLIIVPSKCWYSILNLASTASLILISNSLILNLMFLWPCIMNWLYINYQL